MKKVIFLLSSIFILSSCLGPQGPEGPQGLDGNVNVRAYEYEVFPNAWQANGIPGNANYGFVAASVFPEITNSVLNNGAVVGYYLDGTSQSIMPAILYYDGYHTNYDFILYPGEAEFWVRDSDLQTTAPNQSTFYRMVVIQGRFKDLPDLETVPLDYLEQYFNISEEDYIKVQVK